jgi:hypothetical protein
MCYEFRSGLLRHPSTRIIGWLSSPHPKVQMMQTAVQTVLIVLGEIPLSKLLEIFH